MLPCAGMIHAPDLPRSAPSSWVRRFADRLVQGGRILDVAAGRGRHSRFLLEQGFRVTAVDCETAGLEDIPALEVVAADLENAPWPFGERRFDGIIVTNYLHRPLFQPLIDALESGGVLVYETFEMGNAQYGRPANPDFLLAPGELLAIAAARRLTVLGYTSGYTESPKSAMVQRLAAVAPR